jgi:hypothetical protein
VLQAGSVIVVVYPAVMETTTDCAATIAGARMRIEDRMLMIFCFGRIVSS